MRKRKPKTTRQVARFGRKATTTLPVAAVVAIFVANLVAMLTLMARPASAADLAILANGFSIRHEHRVVMGTTTRLYLSLDDSSFTDVPTADITGYEKDLSVRPPVVADARPPAAVSPSPARLGVAPSRAPKSGPAIPLNDVVNSASAAYHLDPDLVNSVIHAESGFNAHAISPKGARGLMQLMPKTANNMGVGVNDLFDPQSNVDGGSRYLRELLERYNFDLVKALAAYNAGPQRVEQYGGVPPYRETRAYVNRIVHEYNKKKIAQEKEEKRKQAAVKAPAKTASPAHSAAAKAPSTTIAGQSQH